MRRLLCSGLTNFLAAVFLPAAARRLPYTLAVDGALCVFHILPGALLKLTEVLLTFSIFWGLRRPPIMYALSLTTASLLLGSWLDVGWGAGTFFSKRLFSAIVHKLVLPSPPSEGGLLDGRGGCPRYNSRTYWQRGGRCDVAGVAPCQGWIFVGLMRAPVAALVPPLMSAIVGVIVWLPNP